jgi:hypothetical protein
MKFRISIICVVLLVCGLQLYGQQEDSASPAMLYQRLGRPGSRAREMVTQRSKPALGGAQTAEPSNDLPRNDDSGTYITLDAPGAGTGVNQRTFPFGINPEGGIAGYSIDANNTSHGFVRDDDGAIRRLDPPSLQLLGVGCE